MRRGRRKTEYIRPAILLLAAALLLGGCGAPGGTDSSGSSGSSGDSGGISIGSLSIEPDKSSKNSIDCADLYAQAKELAAGGSGTGEDYGISMPGTSVQECETAVIDYSNLQEGYICARRKVDTGKDIRLKLAANDQTATYFLNTDEWQTFPVSLGDGEYQATVLENVEDSKYAVILTATFSVSLQDEFAPYLRPNQYVDYASAPVTAALSGLLKGGDEMTTITQIFNFVVGSLTYDTDLAATVTQEYIPVLDAVLEKGSGICFDYASLMAALLRCCGIPCKLVTGYAGTSFHAWLSVWSESEGWIEDIIYFDGNGWQRVDPTFADAGGSASEIKEYIGDGNNYMEKFYY